MAELNINITGAKEVQEFLTLTEQGVKAMVENVGEMAYAIGHAVGQTLVTAIRAEHPSKGIKEIATYDVVPLGGGVVVNVGPSGPYNGITNYWWWQEEGIDFDAQSWPKGSGIVFTKEGEGDGQKRYRQSRGAFSLTDNKGAIASIIRQTPTNNIAIYLAGNFVAKNIEQIILKASKGKINATIAKPVASLLSSAGINPAQLSAMVPGLKSATINPLTGGISLRSSSGRFMKVPTGLKGVRIN